LEFKRLPADETGLLEELDTLKVLTTQGNKFFEHLRTASWSTGLCALAKQRPNLETADAPQRVDFHLLTRKSKQVGTPGAHSAKRESKAANKQKIVT
jgi:hypothetical protein